MLFPSEDSDQLGHWEHSEDSDQTRWMPQINFMKYRLAVLTKDPFYFVKNEKSRLMTKPTKRSVHPADSDQPGHPPSLIRVFTVRSMGSWGPNVSSCGQQRLWSDWVDAQADLSLRWAESHLIDFVMRRLKVYCSDPKQRLDCIWKVFTVCHSVRIFWLHSSKFRIIRASSWDYGTYHIDDLRRLRRACPSAQSCQSLRCSNVKYGSRRKVRQKITYLAPLDGCPYAFKKNEFTDDETYHNLMSWLITAIFPVSKIFGLLQYLRIKN